MKRIKRLAKAQVREDRITPVLMVAAAMAVGVTYVPPVLAEIVNLLQALPLAVAACTPLFWILHNRKKLSTNPRRLRERSWRDAGALLGVFGFFGHFGAVMLLAVISGAGVSATRATYLLIPVYGCFLAAVGGMLGTAAFWMLGRAHT